MQILIKIILLMAVLGILSPQSIFACPADNLSQDPSSEVSLHTFHHSLDGDNKEKNGQSLCSDHCCHLCKVFNMYMEYYPQKRIIPYISVLTYLFQEAASKNANDGLWQPPKQA